MSTQSQSQLQSKSQDQIISAVVRSECFQVEAGWLRRGGVTVSESPRLLKHLENQLVRLIFPTTTQTVEEGTAVALICLFDLQKSVTVYAHAAFAGPTANASLRSLYNPPTQAKPQPGVEGNKAILKFVAWKEAAWQKFLVDELELGNAGASRIWLDHFWKALDRMYGGGNLLS